MTKTLFILFLLFAVCTVKSQEQKTISPPEENCSSADGKPVKDVPNKDVLKIEDILGKERVAYILKAKQITIFRVKEFVAERPLPKKGRKKYFAGYEIVKSAKLKKNQPKEFKQIFLEANNYADPNLINKCTFTANIGFEFKVGKKPIKALLSYACEQILILENETELYRGVRSVEIFDRMARTVFKELPAVQSK